MKLHKVVEVPGLTVEVVVQTTMVETHSKLTDHSSIAEHLLEEIGHAVDVTRERLAGIPTKEVRLAEGCK